MASNNFPICRGVHPDPANPVVRADEVEYALDKLDSLDFDTILSGGAETVKEVSWCVAVLYFTSGAQETGVALPLVFKLMARDQGFAWGDVLKILPSFVVDMEARIIARRQEFEREDRARGGPFLSDDELPF